MKKVLGLVAAGVVGFGAWYFVTPPLAAYGLYKAVESGDEHKLESRIDFQSLRQSLKSEFKAKMMAEVTKQDTNPLALLGVAMADGVINTALEGMMTPEGVAKLIKNQKQAEPVINPKTDEKEPVEDEYKITRINMSTFRVINATNTDAPELIFKRYGLGWKLAGIDIDDLNWNDETITPELPS